MEDAEEIVMHRSLITLAAAVALMTGCNTMQGLEKDIGAGGQKVADVLKKDKPADDSDAGAPGSTDSRTQEPETTSIPGALADDYA
jgi:predicted small secreted protein